MKGVGARHASPGIAEQRLHKGDACTAPTVDDSEIAEKQLTESMYPAASKFAILYRKYTPKFERFMILTDCSSNCFSLCGKSRSVRSGRNYKR